MPNHQFKPIPPLTDRQVKNYHRHVNHGQADACWEWQGARDRGYGIVRINRKNFLAHRVGYFIAFGVDPGPLAVCHSCDNPPCNNPAHWFRGTIGDNNRDAWRKGRMNPLRGDAHPSRKHPECLARGDRSGARLHPDKVSRGEHRYNARLSEVIVRQVRELHTAGVPQNKIASHFGVTPQAINLIVKRKNWKHVD